jgi:hypothetical protein
MNVLQRVAVLVIAGIGLWLVWSTRPARLISARVSAISPGNPPIAHLNVNYAAGTLPVSMIAELGNPTAGGSVTLDGVTRYADIPLYGQPTQTFVVHTTAIYRRLGHTISIQRSFR